MSTQSISQPLAQIGDALVAIHMLPLDLTRHPLLPTLFLQQEIGIYSIFRDVYHEGLAFFYIPMSGFKTAVEAWSETADLDGFLGFHCSVVCQPVGLLAASWNIPMVSYFCSSGALSDKEIYPTFTRLTANWLALGPGAIVATVDKFG